MLSLLLVLLSSSFASAQWTAPFLLSTNANSASLNENMGQTIATSGNYVHAVYHAKSSTGVNTIWYTRSNNNGAPGSWDLQTQLSPANPYGAGDTMPLLAVSGANVHVVWGRNMIYTASPPVLNKGYSMYINSNNNGGNWNTEQNLGNASFWPGVAASGSYVYVTLNGHDNNTYSQVYFRSSSNNGVAGSFLPVRTLTTGKGRSEDPAMSAFGCNVHIVWNDNRQGLMGFYYIRSTDAGANWGTETALTPSTSKTYTPTVFASSNTHVVVAYTDESQGVPPSYITTQTSSANGDAGSWTPQYYQSAAAYPAVVQDGLNGYIYLLWEASGSGTLNGLPLSYSVYNGNAWTNPPNAVLYNPGPTAVSGFEPFLALGGSTVHAIYGYNGQIYYIQNANGNPGGGLASGYGVCSTTCNDGSIDGTETDVDCGGGACSGCPIGNHCLLSSDCLSGVCTNQKCAAAPSCNDGIQNGVETDVDCGGTDSCNRCALNKKCVLGSDCSSGNCSSSVCAAAVSSPPTPTCTDGIKNGLETDVDCGGSGACPRCNLNKKCQSNSDCTTNTCSNLLCVAASASTSATITSSSNPSHQCQAIELTASVTSAAGTVNGGNVIFSDGGSPVGTVALSGGVAVLSLSSLTLGGHSITASYGGLTGSFLPSQASFTQTVSGVVRFMTHKRNSAGKIVSARTGLLSHSKIRFVTQTNLSIVPALLPDTSAAYANAPICSLSPLFNQKVDFLQVRSHVQKFLISPPLTTSLDIYARGWPSGEYQFHQPVTVLSSTGAYQQSNSFTLQVQSPFSGILRLPPRVSVVSWVGPRLSGDAHLDFALATIITA